MFAVGTSFAADENVTLSQVDDEITVENDVLSVEEDAESLNIDESSDVVAASNVVTNNTFHNYFDENGTLLDTVSDDELVFEGNFAGIDVDYINVTKSIKLTGNGAIFNGISFNINANNVVIDGFNLTQKSSYLIKVEDMINVTISNNIINFEAVKGDNYAIYANYVDNLNILNNKITYVSTFSDKKFNNAIRVEGDTRKGASKNILVDNNDFNITIPSIAIGYDYANFYNAIPYSEGIKFLYCEDVEITNNKINLRYNATSSGRNTISAIAVNSIFAGAKYDEWEIFVEEFYWNMSKNILIKNNEINALGNSDIFGISLSADNFEISDNKLNISADKTYASAISFLSAACNGNVVNNNLSAYAPSDVYVIYSADSFLYYTENQCSNIENITYYKNNMYGAASLPCGMELFESYSKVIDNIITLEGNYTWGIVQSGAKNSVISHNTIYSLGTNSAKVQSGDPILPSNSMGISVKGSALIENNNIVSTSTGINLVEEGTVTINNNVINVVANNDTIANYAISASEIDSLNITGNEITFVGKSNGDAISRALSISYVDGVIVSKNTFDITIPSCGYSYVIYDNPAKGIVFSYSEGAIFDDNVVDLKYDGVIGSWDTINVIEIGYNSDNAVISNNLISALGGSYVYGIKAYGKNFNISENTLTVTSELNYANGVNPEAGATGLVKDNTIVAIGVDASYPIYSGMYGGMGNLDVDYIGNQIYGKAYYVVAVELGGANENVINNTIIAEGNYTIGIGSNSENNTISGNIIQSLGTSIGNQSVWDNLGLVTTGVKILKANATISNNTIEVPNGDYAIDLNNTDSTVDGNYLASKKSVGKDAIANPGSGATIANLSPSLKTVLFVEDATFVYKDGSVFYVKALDENGDPISNITIQAIYGFNYLNATTDAKGVAEFVFDLDADEYDVTFSFRGNQVYGPKTATAHISVSKKPTVLAAADKSLLVTATKSGVNYKIVLKDNSGNVLAGKKVTITFNGKTSTATTNAKGEITYKLVAAKVGTYKLSVKFAGDDNYAESAKTTTIKVTKEATKLTAKNKKFKKSKKVKKYSVTLKDSKGKAIKKVKVTIKVGKKTFKAKTNAKGKATFKIKKLNKKGTYKAKVNFAGNNLYNKVAKSVKITVKK